MFMVPIQLLRHLQLYSNTSSSSGDKQRAVAAVAVPPVAVEAVPVAELTTTITVHHLLQDVIEKVL